MELDDPEKRRAFRKCLSQLGIEEVRYGLGAGKYSKQKAAIVTQWIADVESGATIEDELVDVVEMLGELKERFVKGSNLTGYFLQTDDEATFERLFLEAKTLVDERLGKSSDYSHRLVATYNDGLGGFTGGPSLACVTGVIEIIRGAIKQMRRRPPGSTLQTVEMSNDNPYIAQSRLEEISAASSAKWDLSRLTKMCVELNAAYKNENYISVAILVRSIIDHVPPVFGKANFGEVANNHGSRSFRESMQHLDKSMRKIADAHLHEQIRQKESLPNAVQVDVRRDLDVLLAEVVRSA